MYGWTRHYVLFHLTVDQLLSHYKYGFRYDYERHGFKFKAEVDAPSFDDIAKKYYTDEELKEREKFLKRQFGDDIEGL